MPSDEEPKNHDGPAGISRAIDKTIRNDWGKILASLTKTLGDIQLAEDCLQDAVESALTHWHRNGLPNSPAAWLLQTARRKAIDRLRRHSNFKSKEADIAHLAKLDALDNEKDITTMQNADIPDQRLEMIFTCCHPAIEEKSRTALTLRVLGGLSTAEIAKAFLDKPDAMAARLTRAKKKIALAGIAYEIPKQDQLEDRLKSVLDVIYLIFNEGYQASNEEDLIRTDLTLEAVRLAKIVHELLPKETEPAGLLALLMLHTARQDARTDEHANMISLEHQNRDLWDHERISAACELLKQSLSKGAVGPYQLQAAISACHCEAKTWEKTDWPQIVALYRLLETMIPSPVLTLNRLVAQSNLEDATSIIAEMEALEEELSQYQPFHAAHADILRKAGRSDQARLYYEIAIRLSQNNVERSFLINQMNSLTLH